MTRYSVIAARLDLVCRRAATALAPVIRGSAADLCVLLGVAWIGYGVWLIAKPAAFIFLGMVCIVIGLRGVAPPPAPGAPD